MDECTSASSYNKNCTEYKYANTGDDIYWRIIRTNHDESIRLLYSGTSPDTTKGTIGRSKFNTTKNDPMYFGYMYGTSGSLANNRTNTNNSIIKGVIDTWYKDNLNINYGKYISTEAVYCNDRELEPGQKYSTSSAFNYAPYGRLDTNKTPTYNCTNNKDAFSGNNSEAKLTYPIALMTADEIAYAGGKKATGLSSPYAWYYLNSAGGSITGKAYWWLMSPFQYDGYFSLDSVVMDSTVDSGLLSGHILLYANGVRPAISLKTCTLWTSGDGSPSNPYEIDYDNSNC